MQWRNNKELVPFEHYRQRFAQMDAAEAARRLALPFEDGAFAIRFLNDTYFITHPDYAIRCERADAPALRRLPAQTFLLRYLLEGKNLPRAGGWKTFQQLPWGEVYLQPFTGRCLNRSAFTFGPKLDRFAAAAKSLGAEPVATGDAGFEFEIVQEYRIRLSVWQADDEFGPSAQILFSDNFAAGFLAEESVVAAELLIGAICGAMA